MAPFRADLHVHTNRSDGTLSPTELVEMAQAIGLSCLAVADHDSLAGVAEATAAGARLGVAVIPSVELSVRDPDPATGRGGDDHLLGFFVDPSAPTLASYLAELQETRLAMARETIQRLKDLGVPVDPDRVAELATGAVVTRPHIARALVEAGHVASEREAFDRFLGTGRPAAAERPSPTAATAIEIVRSAGGTVALAHPVFAQDPEWAEKLERVPGRLDDLAARGLAAVECSYPDATPAIAERLLAWTLERRLLPIGGSDYHGPGKAPYVSLGHVTVDRATVDRLRDTRPGAVPA